MKPKIGIFGSAVSSDPKVKQKLRSLGEILADKEIVLISGATTGTTYVVLKAAHDKNPDIEIWGYSPACNFKEHNQTTRGCDNSIYKKLLYIDSKYEFAHDLPITRKLRNVYSTSHCDAGIILSGRWGTLNEFTNLFDMGKVIGVLTETGGIADELKQLMQKINKPSKAKVFFQNSPIGLVKIMLKELNQRHE